MKDKFLELLSPVEKKSTKKILLLSLGKYLSGIVTFIVVFNILLPSPSLPIKIVAQKTATMIAEYTESYYIQTGSLNFINTTYIYGYKIVYDENRFLELPQEYKCTILDSSIVVEHKTGIKATERWR